MSGDTVKRISQCDPVAAGREASEQYYADVHTRFARRMFRERAPLVRRYLVNRAVAQYESTGGFQQEPQAWRFIVTEVAAALLEGSDEGNAAGFLPEDDQRLVWHDHLSCLCNLRGFEVRETTLLRNPAPVPTSVKYLVLLDPRRAYADARAYYEKSHLPALRAILDDAYGAQLVLSNVVERQAEVAPLAEPGQVYTGRYLAEPDRVAYEELYFDNVDWAEEFFARRDVYDLYLRAGLLDVEAYRVEEDVGIWRA